MQNHGVVIGVVLILSVAGCRQPDDAAVIKQRFDAEHVRSAVDNAQLEVRNAELGEEMQREKRQRVDPMPLLRAKALLSSAELNLRMLQDQEKLERDLAH